MHNRLLAVMALMLPLGPVGADGDHRHAFAADIKAFHDQLAPLWHAPAGATRLDNACKAVPALVKLAADVRSQDATGLNKSLSQLQQDCKANSAQIEQAFSAVHDAIHHLIDEPTPH